MTLEVRPFFDRESCTYTYLVFDSQTHEGALIDPVAEHLERDQQWIRELGIELKYLLETHVHADHITSAGKLKNITGAQMVLGKRTGVECADILMEEGDTLPLGNYQICAITTPGHTNGCTCYQVENHVFTGDTLLIRGCGRTDFQQGSPERLYQSITQKLFTLPENTYVHPGHDYQGRTISTIREEKLFNPRIGNGQSQKGFVDIMNQLHLAQPKKIQEAVPANMNCGLKGDPMALNSSYNMDKLYHVFCNQSEKQLIVDVRSPEEYAEAHVPGSVNIPLGEELQHASTFDQYDEVYLYCRSGRRAQTVMSNLKQQDVENLACVAQTGMPDWIEAGYPTEVGSLPKV